MEILKSVSFRRSLVSAIVIAIVSGLVALAANLYSAASALRDNVYQERRLQSLRTLNLLIVIRDELASIDQNISEGSLTLTTSGRRLVRTRSRWPTQVWSVARWNGDLLSIDSSLIVMLSSLYDQIYRMDSLSNGAETIEAVGSVMSPYIPAMMEGVGAQARREIETSLNNPPPETQGILGAYADGMQRIRPRLRDVVTALDVKIKELQKEGD